MFVPLPIYSKKLASECAVGYQVEDSLLSWLMAAVYEVVVAVVFPIKGLVLV